MENFKAPPFLPPPFYFIKKKKKGLKTDPPPKKTLTQALVVTGYACFVKFVQWGGGKHFAEIPADWHEQLAFWAFIKSPIDNTGISTVKISIAFFLRRFVKGKKMSWFLNGMIAFCVLFIVATILTFVLACEPMEAAWKPVEGSTCWSAQILSDAGIANGGVLQALNDLVCLWGDLVFSNLIHFSRPQSSVS